MYFRIFFFRYVWIECKQSSSAGCVKPLLGLNHLESWFVPGIHGCQVRAQVGVQGGQHREHPPHELAEPAHVEVRCGSEAHLLIIKFRWYSISKRWC